MKKISLPMSVLIIFCIVFFSCQKDAIENNLQALSNKSSLEELKSYYQNEMVASARGNKGSKLNGPAIEEPDWPNALYSAEEKTYLVPVKIKASRANKDILVSRYLVITETNSKKDGFFYYAIADMKTNKSISQQQVLNSLHAYDDGAKEIKKTGNTFVKVPLHQNELFLKEMDRATRKTGKFIAQKKASQTQQPDGSNVSNFAPIETCESSGGAMVTIDWYYQYYVNGELMYEIYVFSTTQCMGGSSTSGGGGGGGGSSCYTEIDAQNILNTVSLSNPNILTYELGAQTTAMGIIREPKNSTWEFCKIAASGIPTISTPRFSAKFTGIRFKYTSPVRDPWKWEAFEYDRTVQSGGMTPACFMINVSPIVSSTISSDKSKAIVVIDYTVNVSVSYGGVSGQVQRPYSKSENANIYAIG